MLKVHWTLNKRYFSTFCLLFFLFPFVPETPLPIWGKKGGGGISSRRVHDVSFEGHERDACWRRPFPIGWVDVNIERPAEIKVMTFPTCTKRLHVQNCQISVFGEVCDKIQLVTVDGKKSTIIVLSICAAQLTQTYLEVFVSISWFLNVAVSN